MENELILEKVESMFVGLVRDPSLPVFLIALKGKLNVVPSLAFQIQI